MTRPCARCGHLWSTVSTEPGWVCPDCKRREAEETHSLAYRIALSRLRRREDAEDVAQDVALALLVRPPAGRVEPYVQRIAMRRAIDVWRSRQLRWGRGSARPGAHRRKA